MSKTEIVTSQSDAQLAPLDGANDVMSIMRLVVERGGSVETLERLVALKERVDDRAAAEKFNAAMAAFQAECPSIQRKSIAEFATNGGGKMAYRFATLDQINKVTQPLLSKHGLSRTWDSSVEGDKLKCVCTIRHVGGHSQSASFTCPTESKAGMSAQQKFASALTYAERQSLIQVLGLTTCDPDIDGATLAPITFEQVEKLEALIKTSGADRALFLKHLKVGEVSEILASDFDRAEKALEAKIRTKGGAK